jgi:hypothetical protein
MTFVKLYILTNTIIRSIMRLRPHQAVYTKGGVMNKRKELGLRVLASIYRSVANAMDEIDEKLARANALVRSMGYDLELPPQDPPPKIRRKAKKARGTKGNDSLRVLKIRGRAIGTVIAAGYPTFAKLNGASKKKLLSTKGVGKGVVLTLERELKKRGMSLRD